jgi:hypothetical protein
MAGKDQGGGSRRPTRQEMSGAFDNLPGLRDPSPKGRSEERPSLDGLWGAGALTPSILPNCSALQQSLASLGAGQFVIGVSELSVSELSWQKQKYLL